MSKPKLSAIVSYYNGSRFLMDFLENYKEQEDVIETEMVFVPCLLSNSDKQIILDFKEKNPDIKIILLEQSILLKQSECWNIGIVASNSDWVTIWNIDDLRSKNSLKTTIKLIESKKNVVGVTGNFVISRKFKDFFGIFIDHTKYSGKEFTRSMILGPFFAFKKQVCESIGYFDEQLKVCSDFDFAIRLAAFGEIFVSNSVLGYFLDEGKGLSTTGNGIQPLERTLVEIRYNILDKIENKYIPLLNQKENEYSKEYIIQFGNKIFIKHLIANFASFMQNNKTP